MLLRGFQGARNTMRWVLWQRGLGFPRLCMSSHKLLPICLHSDHRFVARPQISRPSQTPQTTVTEREPLNPSTRAKGILNPQWASKQRQPPKEPSKCTRRAKMTTKLPRQRRRQASLDERRCCVLLHQLVSRTGIHMSSTLAKSS